MVALLLGSEVKGKTNPPLGSVEKSLRGYLKTSR